MKDVKRTSLGFILAVEAAVIVVGLLVTVYFDSGKLVLATLFIDMPTLIIILLFSIPAMLCSGMWKDFTHAFTAGTKGHSVSDLKRSEKAVSMMQQFVFAGGFFCAFVSLIVCLSQLNNQAVMGKNIAVICISGLYTVVIEFLLIPVSANVQKALIAAMDIEEE